MYILHYIHALTLQCDICTHTHTSHMYTYYAHVHIIHAWGKQPKQSVHIYHIHVYTDMGNISTHLLGS